MNQWYVVYTQPSREIFAQQNLKDQGFDVYLPLFKKIRRHARKVEEVLAPLFPRYLFASLTMEAQGWRCINGTRGVVCVLTQNETPSVVPSSVVEAFKAQESKEGVVTLNSLTNFVKGDKVRVLEGAFEGLSGTVDALDDKRRVQLLLDFLGRDVKVLLPEYSVEAE